MHFPGLRVLAAVRAMHGIMWLVLGVNCYTNVQYLLSVLLLQPDSTGTGITNVQYNACRHCLQQNVQYCTCAVTKGVQ